MIELDRVKTYPLKKRFSKVNRHTFARSPVKQQSFLNFYRSLPDTLKAKDLRAVVDAIVRARRKKRGVIFMAGAHVIKCGLNPVLIQLMKKGVLTCICLNGSGIIHDFEIAWQGRTSEEVGEALNKGAFGMAKETAEFIHGAVREGVACGLGLGDSVARKISATSLPYKDISLLYHAYKQKIPLCVFVAVGADVIHQHPSFDAGLTAEASFADFKSLVENLHKINNGGVVLNCGSAVILPEVFLKALNLARNLGFPVKDFVAANFDMIYHYRPQQNVVLRPTASGGKGYYLIGHHEIMLPLLAQAVVEKL